MATQVIQALIIIVVGYVVTGVALIEVVMRIMGRLDDPAASARGRCRAIECQVEATLSFQAAVGNTYMPEGYTRKTIEEERFRHPLTSDPLRQFPRELQEPTSSVVFNTGCES